MFDIFVIDANVVLSSLINKGTCFSLFMINYLLKRFEFIAPEFLLKEVKNNKSRIFKSSKLSEQEFEEMYEFLIDEISFIPAKDFIQFLPKARQLAPHSKDESYVALHLSTKFPICSGDKGLQKSKLNVLSPKQVLDLLLG